MEPAARIDQQIAELPDWRGQLFSQLRRLIHAAAPDIREEWKWEAAVFVHQGNVCAVAPFKDHLKLNFFQGAQLPDLQGLFNAGLEAKRTRDRLLCRRHAQRDEPAGAPPRRHSQNTAKR